MDFITDKEWAVVKSEIFKKNPEYSNPIREILLKLQFLLNQIDACCDNEFRSQLIVEYMGYKDMYFSFINCQN